MWRCVFFDDGRYVTFYVAFLTPDPSQTEILGKFLEIYFWAVRFPPISAKRKEVRM